MIEIVALMLQPSKVCFLSDYGICYLSWSKATQIFASPTPNVNDVNECSKKMSYNAVRGKDTCWPSYVIIHFTRQDE